MVEFRFKSWQQRQDEEREAKEQTRINRERQGAEEAQAILSNRLEREARDNEITKEARKAAQPYSEIVRELLYAHATSLRSPEEKIEIQEETLSYPRGSYSWTPVIDFYTTNRKKKRFFHGFIEVPVITKVGTGTGSILFKKHDQDDRKHEGDYFIIKEEARSKDIDILVSYLEETTGLDVEVDIYTATEAPRDVFNGPGGGS